MAIKKSELYSSLWSGCDELRGGMDAKRTRVVRSDKAPYLNKDLGFLVGFDLFDNDLTIGHFEDQLAIASIDILFIIITCLGALPIALIRN